MPAENPLGRSRGSNSLMPGLAAGASSAGSRIDGDLRNQLSERRGQIQQTRDGSIRDRTQTRYENRDQMVADRRSNMQSRLDDRKQIIEDRQQNRDSAREDRQDFRDDAREDRQDWAEDQDWDSHHWDDHWDNHHWHNDFEDYWDHMWDEHPVYSSFRVTAWGINRASYLFGWGAYANPYAGGGGGYAYSQPLVVNTTVQSYQIADDASEQTSESSDAPGLPPEAVKGFDQARAEFKAGRYQESLTAVDSAIQAMPRDAALHEFRSLVLFALGRYEQSAAAIHAVLAVGPGWDWTTMSRLYGDADDYTRQLRALEAHIRENDGDAAPRLLLAYHYVTCRHIETAKGLLQKVIELQPEDRVAVDLLTMIGGAVPTSNTAPPSAPAPGPKATEQDLIGSWTAKGPSGSSFALTLAKAGDFTWAYSQGDEKQEVKGVFVIDDGVLAMEPDSGGLMAANVSKPKNGQFTFQQVASTEAALTFRKQ